VPCWPGPDCAGRHTDVRVPIYHVDAFADRVFAGNPAAVCPLERWLPEGTLLAIAAENNLSETAFLVPEGDGYHIRWFTPEMEVDLCGHATLASAQVVMETLRRGQGSVTFRSRSGDLLVTREGDLFFMVLPRHPPERCEPPLSLLRGLRRAPVQVLRSRDYLAVFGAEEEVRALEPEMEPLRALDAEGIIATAPGREADFVSRYFAPRSGITEDPVTGSAHCALTPYWSVRLGKRELRALQVSRRGGELLCRDRGDAVVVAGRAVRYLEGTIAF
jgi:predicted PhzF superfamily epimerase YddE/YHI9